MVPYLAQGAVMAKEDAWIFAHMAAQRDDTKSALLTYQATRLERTSKVQKAAWEQGQKEHSVDKDKDGKEFKGGNFAKVVWLYGHNVCDLYP
jgi:salicylate hydroxylase